MLIDSDVLIWYMKENKKARKIVEERPGFSMSVITYMELVQGLRNKKEWTEFQKAMKAWQTSVLHINERISTKAQFYVDSYFLSHSMRLADALIAATPLNTIWNCVPPTTNTIKRYRSLHFKNFGLER